MSSYCYYAPDAQTLIDESDVKAKIEEFANERKKQTYVVCRPLVKEDAVYEYDQAVVIFSSGARPCFLDLGGDTDAFEEYVSDFLEDISFLSDKFKYREKIGRKRNWVDLFAKHTPNTFMQENLEGGAAESRVVDLISSLVVGSINDVANIDLNARSLLDSIKSKIILFDTDQTSFVFRSGPGKKYVIQGLAGSGKTELLLHKMKEIYSNNAEARIAFTCFNKILASSMKERIPRFFDFMRVERQIDWNNKLFCFHSWGSGRDPYSGMYRYICHAYGLSFGALQAGSFDFLCKKAMAEIQSKSGFDPIFDFTFIDESQDFPKSFIALCELVTKTKIFVAGDVFQNIFRPIDEEVSRADMVLKKCYRTDPKNLMFAHALGMGLFEVPVLRWLKPEEWTACGYIYREEADRALVTRDPLRRFEDIPTNFESTRMYVLQDGVSISERILNVIEGIRDRHPTTQQKDIAVIFLDTDPYIYDAISSLKMAIARRLGWEANVSFETKNSNQDKIFISNINNVKGLEFPFVICFAKDIKRSYSFRNALYTMLARSFLESHLILGQSSSQTVVQQARDGLAYILEHGSMSLRIPSGEEIASQKDLIVVDEGISLDDYVRRFCSERDASPRLVAKLISRVTSILEDSEYDEAYLRGLLELEYGIHKKL